MIILSFFKLLMSSHVSLLEVGSIPEEGSSRRISLVSPARAINNCNFLFYPPDRVEAKASFFFSIETRGNILSIYSEIWLGVISLMPQKYCRFSATVSYKIRTSSWGQMPVILFNYSLCLKRSNWKTCPCPDVGLRNPVSIEMVVVLPAPL